LEQKGILYKETKKTKQQGFCRKILLKRSEDTIGYSGGHFIKKVKELQNKCFLGKYY